MMTRIPRNIVTFSEALEYLDNEMINKREIKLNAQKEIFD